MDFQKANDLWFRFKSGDNDALSELYSSQVHKLFSYGLKIHCDEFLVQDCIQEIFIQLIEKKEKNAASDVTPVYLFKALRYKLLEELRSKNRRIDIANSISLSDSDSEMSTEQSIVHSEEEQLRTDVVTAALNTLSDHQKEAIFLKYSQGLDYEQIAELLNIDISSARTLVYRSLKKVKDSIFRKTQLFLFFFRSFRE